MITSTADTSHLRAMQAMNTFVDLAARLRGRLVAEGLPEQDATRIIDDGVVAYYAAIRHCEPTTHPALWLWHWMNLGHLRWMQRQEEMKFLCS